MAAQVDILSTYGAVLLGASFALGLSGIVGLQSVIYFKMYPEDRPPVKALVCAVWMLDWTHSGFLLASLIYYFITFFGIKDHIDHIPWPIALSVVVTAIQTFLVQCFFAQKILRSSNKNWYITAPILLLSLLRLIAACVSTVEMIKLQRYSAFTLHYPGWIFTSGLTLSAGTDVIIAGCLCYFLREMRSRMGSASIMIQVVDTLTLYTLKTGALTCFAAVATLITWLTMPRNLVFLGLHFVIGKLYANSLLASLNTRNELRRMHVNQNISSRHRHCWPAALPILSTDYPHIHQQSGGSSTMTDSRGLPDPAEIYLSPTKLQKLQINVEQTIERDPGKRFSKRSSKSLSTWGRP